MEKVTKGDLVKLVNPVEFIRCGYKLCPKEVKVTLPKMELVEELNKHIQTYFAKHIGWKCPEYIDLEEMLGMPNTPNKDLLDDPIISKINSEMAYAYCQENKFGGRERRIRTKEVSKLKDRIYRVIGTKQVIEGDYYPPSGGYGKYEPGGLVNRKSVRILKLTSNTINSIEDMSDSHISLLTQDINVEKTDL